MGSHSQSTVSRNRRVDSIVNPPAQRHDSTTRLWRRILAAFLALAAIATIIGVFALWPRGEAPEPRGSFLNSQTMAAEAVAGEVVSVTEQQCGSPDRGAVFSGEPAAPLTVNSLIPPPVVPPVPDDPEAGPPVIPTPELAPEQHLEPLPESPDAVGEPTAAQRHLIPMQQSVAPQPPGEEPGIAPQTPVPPAAPPVMQQTCTAIVVAITDGSDAGQRTLLETSGQPGDPELTEGQKIWLSKQDFPGVGAQYGFLDMNRTVPMWVWCVAMIIAIVAVGAWRGLRAIVGLGLALLVVTVFLVPALLRGGPPVPLAVVTGGAAMIPAMFLVHGRNWKTAAALAGTLLALCAAAGLAHVAIASADIRGLADDSNLLIQLYLPTVSVTGLLLAGFIVGALGVLNDTTIAQASTVRELADADGTASRMSLFTSAMRVGQDHIASMVYTLVLAYVGASLPMTLLLSVADRPLLQVLTSDLVATELLRSAVGALALTLAVPITTAIAAVTVGNRAAESAEAVTATHGAE